MTTLADHTVMPPTGAADVSTLQALIELLEAGKPVVLSDADGVAVHILPANVLEVLRQALVTMIDHKAVTIAGSDTVLTTQEAAELLGISRPTLVHLLEADAIPYSKPNRHRRILLEDVLRYQQRMSSVRRSELDAMAQEAAADDSYSSVNGFIATR